MTQGINRHHPGSAISALVGAIAIAVALSSCSSSSTGAAAAPEATTQTKDAELAAMLPDSITSGGVLKVAVPDGSAPLSSVDDSGEPVGMDPDIAEALGQLFGVRVELTAGSFDSQIPGLQAGRQDLAMGEYYVTPERLASVDFVTGWQDYSSFATRASESWKPANAAALCGKKVGVMKGSAEEASIESYNSSKCSEPMTVSSFQDQASSFLALNSSRINAVVTGRGPLEAASKKSTAFKISGKFGGGPCAVAVARNDDSTKLLAAVKAGYDKLIADGTYAEILKKWDTSYGAVEQATIYTKDSTPPTYS